MGLTFLGSIYIDLVNVVSCGHLPTSSYTNSGWDHALKTHLLYLILARRANCLLVVNTRSLPKTASSNL